MKIPSQTIWKNRKLCLTLHSENADMDLSYSFFIHKPGSLTFPYILERWVSG